MQAGESIIATSRAFFEEIVLPIIQTEFPELAAQAAFGLFGYGSEALGLDDELSRDHHWGLRIDAKLPADTLASWRDRLTAGVVAKLPGTFRGQALGEGLVTGAGLALDDLEGFLERTLGIRQAPATAADWLQFAEEDVLHVINGEVWHDPSARLSNIRRRLAAYYPDAVWRRRLAHWCRYYSGMGAYAMHRAILRGNDFYAATAFGKALRWGVQLAFLIDRQYFPYDKWLMAYFTRLPRLHDALAGIVAEAVDPGVGWGRKLELLNQMSEVLDQALVADGIIAPHPKYVGSASSGYRLLEHAYFEIVQSLPAEVAAIVPNFDQIHLERFHSGYVRGLDLDAWHGLINLSQAAGDIP